MKKIIGFLIYLFVILFILVSNIVSTFIIIKNYSNELLSNILICFGLVLLILYILYKVLNKEKLKIKDIIVILLSIFGYISYLFSVDKDIALNGLYGRNEGLYMLLTYYVVFLASSIIPKKNQKIIMLVFILTGVYQVFIGFFQYYRLDYILGYYRGSNFTTIFTNASGTLRNPNFYSTYILLCLVYSLTRLLDSDDKSIKFIYLIFTLYFIYGLLIGDTLGCIISFIIVGLILLLKKINKNNIKKVFIYGLLFLLIVIILVVLSDKYSNTKIIRDINKNINELTLILKNGINDSTGKDRIYVWKKTLELSKNNLITGIGIDNFGVIDNGECYVKFVSGIVIRCFDKVHNEYLQILVTEGIFAFISYISLLIYVIYRHIKNKNDKLNTCLYYCFIAYLIQAITNISVIQVAPFFYMIMGFIVSDDKVLIED